MKKTANFHDLCTLNAEEEKKEGDAIDGRSSGTGDCFLDAIRGDQFIAQDNGFLKFVAKWTRVIWLEKIVK